MKRVAWLVFAVIGVTAQRAQADGDADAIKKVVLEQVRAIGAGDGRAFAKTVAAKDVFGMGLSSYAATAAQVGAVTARAWPKGTNDAKLGKIVVGREGEVAWVIADIEVSPHNPDFSAGTYRATELLKREGGAWKVHAIMISSGTQDWPDTWAKGTWAKSDKPPGAAAPKTAPLADWVAHPAELGAHLHAGPDVVVLGAGTERGEGPTAGSALAALKDIAYTTAWTRAGGDGKTYAWLGARLDRKVTTGAGTFAEPYWVLAMAVKGAKDWELVAVQYTQDAPL